MAQASAKKICKRKNINFHAMPKNFRNTCEVSAYVNFGTLALTNIENTVLDELHRNNYFKHAVASLDLFFWGGGGVKHNLLIETDKAVKLPTER